MAKAQSDKRSNRRVKAQDKVRVKVGNGAVHHAQAQLRDVSLRGVYLYLQNKVMEGSTLEVVLPLPAGILAGPENWIRCKCRVVRVENKGGPEFGVAATIEEYEPVDTTKLKQA
ncbi:MAG: PilZ domain-containing protein [Terriglobales bacterium]